MLPCGVSFVGTVAQSTFRSTTAAAKGIAPAP